MLGKVEIWAKLFVLGLHLEHLKNLIILVNNRINQLPMMASLFKFYFLLLDIESLLFLIVLLIIG